jgi:hypothetical protein
MDKIQNEGKIYEKTPRRIICCFTDSLQRTGDYSNSLANCLKSADSIKTPTVMYRIAVNYAHLNKEDSAFYYLHQFVKISQDDRFLTIDNNFIQLRLNTEKWMTLMKEIEAEYLQELPNTVNRVLALKLFYLGIDDQKYRTYLPTLGQTDTVTWNSVEEVATKYKIMAECQKIFKKYGCPTISMVGKLASCNAFYLLQHSLKIKNRFYYSVKKAYHNGDFDSISFAMLTDRWLMHKNRKQIYGTQLIWNNYKTEKKYPGKTILWPVKDFKNVNLRRKKMGFLTTVEENTKRFHNGYIPPEYYEGKGSVRWVR